MDPTQPTTVLATPVSTWQIILRELNSAPPKVRQSIVFSAVALDLGIAFGLYDFFTGSEPHELQRLAAVICAVVGVLFLVIAQALHQVGQGVECSMFDVPSLKQRRFHRAQVGLPVLAGIATICFSLSIGMMLPLINTKPLVLFMVVFIGAYLVYALKLIQHTTEFLYRHAAEQAEAVARAEAQAAEAHLAALRAQMNPHFLFNALNTVAALIRTNGKLAERTVEDLAGVLRHTLDRSQSNSGTLEEELAYLRSYLAVEQQRFGDRLHVKWQIAEDVLPLNLPPLTLQPLVENALKHGIGSRLEGGEITISAQRTNGTLALRISDDGVGFPARFNEGTGLSNLRQRLNTLYGSAHGLDIATSTLGSTITLTVPATN